MGGRDDRVSRDSDMTCEATPTNVSLFTCSHVSSLVHPRSRSRSPLLFAHRASRARRSGAVDTPAVAWRARRAARRPDPAPYRTLLVEYAVVSCLSALSGCCCCCCCRLAASSPRCWPLVGSHAHAVRNWRDHRTTERGRKRKDKRGKGGVYYLLPLSLRFSSSYSFLPLVYSRFIRPRHREFLRQAERRRPLEHTQTHTHTHEHATRTADRGYYTR